jgi:hypothetical protein
VFVGDIPPPCSDSSTKSPSTYLDKGASGAYPRDVAEAPPSIWRLTRVVGYLTLPNQPLFGCCECVMKSYGDSTKASKVGRYPTLLVSHGRPVFIKRCRETLVYY